MPETDGMEASVQGNSVRAKALDGSEKDLARSLSIDLSTKSLDFPR
jgi:hypothetical protein